MKFSIRQKLLLLFLVSLQGIVITGYFVNKNNRQFIESSKWIEHTQEVLSLTNTMLMLDKEINLAFKGYSISHDMEFMRSIDTSARMIRAPLASGTQMLRFTQHDNQKMQPHKIKEQHINKNNL